MKKAEIERPTEPDNCELDEDQPEAANEEEAAELGGGSSTGVQIGGKPG